MLVQDENDHAPRFENEVYQTEVSESVAPDTQVAAVAATDMDSGANAKIRLVTALVGKGYVRKEGEGAKTSECA